MKVRNIKVCLISFVLLFVVIHSAMAGPVIRFDPSTDVRVVGYYLYAFVPKGDGTFDIQKIDLVKQTEWKPAQTFWKLGVTYQIYVTGYDANKLESLPTDMLYFTYEGESKVIKVPNKPKSITIVFE